MVDHSELLGLAYKLGFTSLLHGGAENNHIRFLWKSDVHISSLHITSQLIYVWASFNSSQKLVVPFVYANCYQ